jgi:ADP-heptose:LPS heptosyltransferase
LIAYYSEAKIRAGVSSHDFEENPLKHLLNIKNEFIWESKRTHQVERNIDILKQLPLNTLETLIRINLNRTDLEFAEKFYSENNIDRTKPVICIHPGAAKEGNVWPAAKFSELAGLLHSKYDSQFVISEGPLDKKYADNLAAIMQEKYPAIKYFRHKGLLMNNLALIGLSDLFISNDTGVMHLASGLDVPLIALFGPTKAFQWGPLGNNKISIQSASANMQNIDINEVFEQSIKLLYYRIQKKNA